MYNDIIIMHNTLKAIADNKLLNAYFWGSVRFIYREMLSAKTGNPETTDIWESMIKESKWGYANIWKNL